MMAEIAYPDTVRYFVASGQAGGPVALYPMWQPTVLGPSRAAELGLPRVSPADVQAVEQGG